MAPASEGNETVKVRIGTWNMNHWQGIRSSRTHIADCWDFICTLELDIALVQEAVPPPERTDSSFLWKRVGRTRPWGTGIFCANGDLRLEELEAAPFGQDPEYAILRDEQLLEESHPGCMKAADVLIDGDYALTVVSIYGIHSNPTLNGTRYVPTTVHRMLSDLTPLLDRTTRKVLLGGDLNISPQIGYPDTRHHEIVIERLKAFGLTDLLGHYNKDYVQTHRHPRSQKPWQDDWIFAGRKLMPSVRMCEAIQTDEAWALSDHCPVVTEIDI